MSEWNLKPRKGANGGAGADTSVDIGAGEVKDTDESGFPPRGGLKISIPETNISRCIQNVNYTDYISLEKKLGKGSFGEVYLGVPTDKFIEEFKEYRILDTSKIAMKLISYKPTDIDTIKAEIEILSQLDNPNIIKYYFCINNSESNQLFIFMEYFEGYELYDFINNIYEGYELYDFINNIYEAKIDINYKIILDIYKKIMDGVSYLHFKNIYHRDLKPENIMINKNSYQIKIIDFGLSCFDKEDTPVGNCLTFNGTPKYLSPISILKLIKYNELKDLYFKDITLEKPRFEAFNKKELAIVDYWAVILILFDLLSIYTFKYKKMSTVPHIFESFNIITPYEPTYYLKNISIIDKLVEENFNLIFDENPDNYFNNFKDNFKIILKNPYKLDLIIEQYNYIKTEVDNFLKEIKEETDFTTPTKSIRHITTTPTTPIAIRRPRHDSIESLESLESMSNNFNPYENPLATPPRKSKRFRKGDNKYYKKYIKYKKKYLMLKHKL
jgi:serine/threonine protein kinase